jgi:predicted ATPase/DNA-binding CsgD family transcriptional regulator/Tfp pilus assembly protein PilF
MPSATALLTGNLPAEPNSFIGRERDLAELAKLLGEVRALTLSGPGGIGKTRLAIRLARNVIADSAGIGEGAGVEAGVHPGQGIREMERGQGDGAFLDEAWLVDLADWRGQTAQRVAATIGVREEPGVPLAQTLAEALRSRRMLLVLDTCEHQVSDCAMLVQLLLARCPWLRIVATSREPLRVGGETVWRVQPLDLPPDDAVGDELAGHEAIRLFAARAAGARPGFTLTEENTASVARLCRTLDGIPLGIELSAARVRALSVEQIADRLRDRFQLLDSGDRTAPPRQQTLRATVDWSYELLDGPEQTLLRRLAVFSGWNLDMAEQVCSDDAIPADAVLGLLISLIDKSLVVLDGEAAGDARYRLLDTIREYAVERLVAAGEESGLFLRHRDCVLALVEDTAHRMFRRGNPPWPVRLAIFRRGIAEYGNFRIALATCMTHGHADEGLRLCTGLQNMWVPHGDQREAATWFDRFLAAGADEVSPRVRGRALAARANIAFDLQEYDVLLRSSQQSLELSRSCGDDFTVPTALRSLGQAALRAGRLGDATGLVDEAIAAADSAGNDWEAGLALAAKAAIAVRQGKLKSAQRAYEAALEVLSDNNQWGVAQVQYGMGTLARARGDADMAVRHFEEAAQIFRELDSWLEIARCLGGVGWVALTRGDLNLAQARLAEGLRLNQACGQRLGIARGLEALAAVAAARQQLERAARLAGAACQLRESLGQATGIGSRVEEMLELARDRLGASTAAALFAEGREMTAEDAVGYALDAQPDTPGSGPPGLSAHPGAGNLGGPGEPAWADPARHAAAKPASPLTAREHEIVLLIVRGLSNRQIADELVISPATAARHVANILAKLGFSSRTQIASWAARHEPPN